MSLLAYFPYPYVRDDQRYEGSIRKWPAVCVRCRLRPCEAQPPGPVRMCSFGVNYQRVDDSLLVAGLVLKNYAETSEARRKRQSEMRSDLVTAKELADAVAAYHAIGDSATAELAQEKGRAIREYVEQERFRPDFLATLRKDIQKGLSFFHDYRQINAQIQQNMNVLFETRYPGRELDDQLNIATKEEKAIYWLAKFLDEKLQVAKFLIEPEWLSKSDQWGVFRVHGMVTKYARIYESQFRLRQVALQLIGESHGEIYADRSACGVVPHTLIDNALKYSKSGSRVKVFLRDDQRGVYLSVTSWGPKLLPDEFTKIFDPFYRGEGAKQLSPEGAGYGLYVAQLIASRHLGTAITVRQADDDLVGEGYETEFDLTFPWKCKGAR